MEAQNKGKREVLLRVCWTEYQSGQPDRSHATRLGEVMVDMGRDAYPDPTFTAEDMQAIAFAAKMEALRRLAARSVPKKKPKISPFSVGQRWYCQRTKLPSFTFVIVGPGSKKNRKLCRIELDRKWLQENGKNWLLDNEHRYGDGDVQEYSHAHLKRRAVLQKEED